MILPFQVHFPEPQLMDLKARLSQTRWPDEIVNSGWKYGSNRNYMQELAGYWLNVFDWRKQERMINSFPNYMADIDGFNIHFIQVKGNGKKNFPLIITHGWPGSFLEMLPLIPMLTRTSSEKEEEFAFDVIVPSMPGFGLSQKSNEDGMNAFRIASLWAQLMDELGYEKFAAQGGDFGAGVTTALAMKYPEKITGIHLNYIPGSYHPVAGSEKNDLNQEEIQSIKDADKWYTDSGAYAHVQKTWPLTLAYGLNDSPVALAAWITEKFYEWGDCNGNIENRFSKDELLTSITLYWLTQTIHSSCRLYVENNRVPFHFKKGETINVPCGIAHFPKEAPFPPRKFIERVYSIRHWTDMPSGGHFAALEEPELLANDLFAFFKTISSS